MKKNIKFIVLAAILFLYRNISCAEKDNESACDFLAYSLPFVKQTDDGLDKISDTIPVNLSSETLFMSHWLDEGSNPSPHGMNIYQIYSASIPVSGHCIGYEYFQASYEHARPHTLEIDHTVFAELNFGILTLKPMWTYVDIPVARHHDEELVTPEETELTEPEEDEGIEDDDSGEIGLEISLDCFLNPYFTANYDYKKEKGYYCQWGISHNFCFQKFGTFTPSVSMGMNSRKGTEHTFLTHIDFGMDYTFPISKHLNLAGFIHLTKGLKEKEGFEDIVPWGGFGLVFEL